MTGVAMSRFGELLKEARKRTKLTQQELGGKIPVDGSYISKMETGKEPPPTRYVAVKLADALGINDKIRRLVFFLTAYVAGDEDMEGLTLVKLADGEAEEEEEQASSTPLPTMAHSALALPDSLFDNLGGEIEEIKGLIASTHLTDEEEKIVKSALDTAKRLLLFIEDQRKMRKEG
jgi:transcriptional regulator with XRE-family HTH domain